MAAINFPSSPTNGQVFTEGDKTWTYSTAVGAWRLQTQTSAGATGATGAGVVTGGTVGQVLAKNSSTAFDTTWASVGSAARPFTPSGAYLSGSGLVVNALTGNYASTPDSPPLDITGDIEIVARLSLDSAVGVGVSHFVLGKWGGGSQRSYYIQITNSGASTFIGFAVTPDGTFGSTVSFNSTADPAFVAGIPKWIKITLDVNDGSGNKVAKFYTAADQSTEPSSWTQLGTTITSAGTTSIFAGTDPLWIGAISAAAPNMDGTVHRAIIRSGFDGAAITVFDADFSTQTADALAFNATSDAGIKADGLVLKGVVGQNATVPDSAALSITGDIDIKVRATVPDWTPTTLAPLFLAKRQDAGNQQSFSFELSGSGVLTLTTSPNGTGPSSLYTASTAIVGATDGTAKWVRATMDVNDGAGNRVTKFYTSDNGTTWTQLGTTVTAVGATSIFDSSIPLEIGSRNAGVNNLMNGTIHRVIIQSAYDTADNTTSLVFDADFDAQAIGTTSFVESSSNAAVVTINNTNPTVTINTTRYSYGIPNTQSGTISTASLAAGSDRYQRFVITQRTVVDMVLMEVTTGPASAATVYFGLYAADANFQPTGNVLLATDIAVGTSATGVFTKQVTPVTLQPGTYLLATNPSVTMTVRTLINGGSAMVQTYGASGSINTLSRTRTAAAFGNNPSAWDTVTAGSTVGSINYALLRWREAT